MTYTKIICRVASFSQLLNYIQNAFWNKKCDVHVSSYIRHWKTVLKIDFERTYSSISSSSASWFYPTCQYRKNEVVNILWCTCDLLHIVSFLYIPHHHHEGVSILICLCQTWLHALDATWHMYLWGCLSCVPFAPFFSLYHFIER